MRTYSRSEIENKHGVYIAYWSKQPGSTELEKWKNFNNLPALKGENSKYIEFVIPDKQGNDINCFLYDEEGPNGYLLTCFNSLGETILDTDDCYHNDRNNVLESLKDYGIL